jgi:hypothetical protein
MTFGPLRAWRSRAAVLRFVRRTLQVFGICWLLLEPLALWRPDDLRWGLFGYLGLLAFSALVGVAWAWPKAAITRKLPISDTKLTIEVSDLLTATDNVIIGVTDVFDTELGTVISPKSIQGQFQSRFFPDLKELDRRILEALKDIPFEIDDGKVQGKNARYPIGTVVRLDCSDRRFYLLAYSHMSSDIQAKSDICKLTRSLEVCWETIRVTGQHEPVHIPIIGSRFSRTGLPRSLLLQFIILSFLDEERKSSLTNHLYVHVAPQDRDEVDFVVLEDWLAGITRVG